MKKDKNKFYFVFDGKSYDYDNVLNVVIAPNAKRAKVLGHGYEATEESRFIDIRVRAVATGDYWLHEDEEVHEVVGEGFVYTDLPERSTYFEVLEEELIKKGRLYIYKEEKS